MYGMRIHHIQCGCHGFGHGYGQEHRHTQHKHANRHFLTKDEKIEKLQEYISWLENELKGVEETIDQIRKE